MAKTQLHNYSVQEKLNKMDIDVIQVEQTLIDAASTPVAGDIMFTEITIPDAVAVEGGTCMIHSITALLSDNAAIASSDGANLNQSFRIIFSNDDTSLGALDAAIGDIIIGRSDLVGIQGFTDMVAVQDLGRNALFAKTSIGIVAKAKAGSRDLYITGISQSDDDYNGGTITLNIGIIKD